MNKSSNDDGTEIEELELPMSINDNIPQMPLSNNFNFNTGKIINPPSSQNTPSDGVS